MTEAGIVVQPSLEDAGRDDWLVMSIPAQAEVGDGHPDPRPSAAWFEHMMSVRPDTEREVELHFASPLFCALGYGEDQEAAGFGIRMAQGSRPQRIEADLVYFADERRSPDDSDALVLVECKIVIKDLEAAARQVRSYALWLVPAYYVITDAQTVSVWDFQGAIAPDREVLTIKQDELEEKFDDLVLTRRPLRRHARARSVV